MKIELTEYTIGDNWYVRARVERGEDVLQYERCLGPDLFASPNEKMSTYYKNHARNEVTRDLIEHYYSED